jgi:hypothetical protein
LNVKLTSFSNLEIQAKTAYRDCAGNHKEALNFALRWSDQVRHYVV